MKIAVDIASADNPLEELVGGCADALNEREDIEVAVVGDEGRIESVLSKLKFDRGRLSVHHTDEVIEMHESPTTGIKYKKNASIVVGANLVRDGVAQGLFSPGNTGATLAASLMFIGRLKGVLRPALGSRIPTATGGQFLLFDVGANVDCTPEYITQFAIMGSVLCRFYWGLENPRVGLLNVGEEETKGDTLSKKTYEKLSKLPINFIGNIEANKMFLDTVDVVVADGFVGNAMLKTIEGTGKAILEIMKSSVKNGGISSKIGAMLMKDSFKTLKQLFVADSYGGAPLVGVNGAVTVGHGHSSALAVKNGIFACAHYAETKVSEHIVETLRVYGHSKMRIFD